MTEKWTYEGPENWPVQSRNVRGEYGRVKVTTGERNRRVIAMDGFKLEVPYGLAEELVSALTTSLRPHAGSSIMGKVSDELEAVIDRLMSGDGEADDDRDPGRAEAYTMVLAIIRNPYAPDYPAEKKRQMERWEANNA